MQNVLAKKYIEKKRRCRLLQMWKQTHNKYLYKTHSNPTVKKEKEKEHHVTHFMSLLFWRFLGKFSLSACKSVDVGRLGPDPAILPRTLCVCVWVLEDSVQNLTYFPNSCVWGSWKTQSRTYPPIMTPVCVCTCWKTRSYHKLLPRLPCIQLLEDSV